MGHSTSSGRASGGQRTTLTEEERIALRRDVANREENAAEARERLRNYVQQLRDDARTLDDIYSSRNDDETPEETVRRFETFVGQERAGNVIATLVNDSAWDGRISRANSQWASGVSGALKESENTTSRISSGIHKAHLDQIASAKRRLDNEREFRSANEFSRNVLRRNNRSR